MATLSNELKLLFVIFKQFVVRSKSRKMQEYRKKKGLTKGKLIQIIFKDEGGKSIYCKLGEKGLHYKISTFSAPETILHTDTTTMLNIMEREKKVLNLETGEIEYEPYSIGMAVATGDMVAEGAGSSADLELAEEAFYDLADEFREEFGPLRK